MKELAWILVVLWWIQLYGMKARGLNENFNPKPELLVFIFTSKSPDENWTKKDSVLAGIILVEKAIFMWFFRLLYGMVSLQWTSFKSGHI